MRPFCWHLAGRRKYIYTHLVNNINNENKKQLISTDVSNRPKVSNLIRSELIPQTIVYNTIMVRYACVYWSPTFSVYSDGFSWISRNYYYKKKNQKTFILYIIYIFRIKSMPQFGYHYFEWQYCIKIKIYRQKYRYYI